MWVKGAERRLMAEHSRLDNESFQPGRRQLVRRRDDTIRSYGKRCKGTPLERRR